MKPKITHLVNELNRRSTSIQIQARDYLAKMLQTLPDQRIDLEHQGCILFGLSDDNLQETPVDFLMLDNAGLIHLGQKGDRLEDTIHQNDRYTRINWIDILTAVKDTLGRVSDEEYIGHEFYIAKRSESITPDKTLYSNELQCFKESNIVVDGTLLLEKWAREICYVRFGLFIVQYDDGAFVIDYRGRIYLSFDCASIAVSHSGEVNRAKHIYDRNLLMFEIKRTDGKMNYARIDGKPILPDWYDKVGEPWKPYLFKYVQVKENGKYNYMNIENGVLAYPDFFEEVGGSMERFAKAKQQWGHDLVNVVKYKGQWMILLADRRLIPY